MPYGSMKDLGLFSELFNSTGGGEKTSNQIPGMLPEETTIADLMGDGGGGI